MAKNTLSYEGCNYFRQRIVLATLSGKSVKIKKIRARDDDPGLKGQWITGTCFYQWGALPPSGSYY